MRIDSSSTIKKNMRKIDSSTLVAYIVIIRKYTNEPSRYHLLLKATKEGKNRLKVKRIEFITGDCKTSQIVKDQLIEN